MSDNTGEVMAEREAAVARVTAAGRAERALSQVGWWAPEIAGTTVVAGVGATVVHPVAAVIAAAALGARIGWAHLRNRRSTSVGPDSADAVDAAEDAVSPQVTAESAEGVA